MQIKNIILTVFLALICPIALSDLTSEAKDFAKDMNNSVVKDASNKTKTDTSDIPNYAGENVAEKSYYDDPNDLSNKAVMKAATDPTAQYVKDSHTNGSRIALDPSTDPLLKRYEEISEKSNSLTGTYSGCVELPVGAEDVTKYEDKTCHVKGTQATINYSCNDVISVSCPNALTTAKNSEPFVSTDFSTSGNTPFPKGSSGETFWWGGTNDYRTAAMHGSSCATFVNQITFIITDLSQIDSFTIDSLVYDDWLDISVNDTHIFRGVGSNQDLDQDWSGKCEQGKNFSAGGFNIMPALKVGVNTIWITNQIGGGGGMYIQLTAHKIHGCDQLISSTDYCPVGETVAGGTYLGSTCSEGAGTKIVDGLPIYRDCWAWKKDYTRLDDPVFNKDVVCSELESQGCGITTSVCQDFSGGYCKDSLATYSCPFVTAPRNVSLCGSQLICPDGKCTADIGQTYEPATEDLKKAATAMAITQDMASQFDVDTISVFKGSGSKCSKLDIGGNNCCKDSGWALDLSLASCSAEEKTLGLAKENGLTHYIGKYQTGGFLDSHTHFVYCVFPSKLSRIVVEQGKPQLGLDFGTAKKPDCSGFTMDQVDMLNFDAMDLSEFYEDVMDKANAATVPDASALGNEMAEKLKLKYPTQVK